MCRFADEVTEFDELTTLRAPNMQFWPEINIYFFIFHHVYAHLLEQIWQLRDSCEIIDLINY